MPPIIFLIGLVVACLFFLFVAIMGVRTWRVVHLLSAIFLFISAVAFTSLLAMSAKTNVSWKQRHTDLTERLVAAEAETIRLTVGDKSELDYKEDSLIGYQYAMKRETYGRGRVWRGCRAPAGLNQTGQLIVTTPQPVVDPAVADDPNAVVDQVDNKINPNSMLHLFSQKAPNAAGHRLPELYLGQFRVVSATPTNVTLEPMTPVRSNALRAKIAKRIVGSIRNDANRFTRSLRRRGR